MSDESLSELASKLIAAERTRPGPAPELAARLVERIGASAASAPVVKASLAVKWLAGAAGLLVGASTTVAYVGPKLEALREENASLRAELERAREREAVPAPAPRAPEPAFEPVVAAPEVKPALPPARAAPKRDTLPAENALLERARTALLRREPKAALDAVDQHAAAFPHGQLNEEREALAVQALVSLHRVDEAKMRAAEFQAAYPRSLLWPAVKAGLDSMP